MARPEPIPASARVEIDESSSAGVGLGLGEQKTLNPPYDFGHLSTCFETSSYLRPNIDAYAVNIDSHGHRFTPRIDLQDPGSREVLRELLEFDRWMDARARGERVEIDENVEVTEAAIDAAMERLKVRMRRELVFLKRWFATACMSQSFMALRREVRVDLEKHGNAYLEVIRDDRGDVVCFERVKSRSVRIRRRESAAVESVRLVVRTPLKIERLAYSRQFRTYVQEVRDKRVFFKEFGDPRVISRQTGEPHVTVAAMRLAEKNPRALPAHEIVHFKITGSDSEYGIPRWSGAFLSVVGARTAEQVNIDYFENPIPPVVAAASNGRFTKDTKERVQSILDERKGSENFHKFLILEVDPVVAEGAAQDATAQARVDLKPLHRPDDATHRQYDVRSGDKVGSQFRMPKILRGETDDVNRATANVSLRMGDGQVWGPERREFDAWFNDFMMPAIGVAGWLFESMGPRIVPDVDTTAKVTVDAHRYGVLTRGESRRVLAECLGLQLAMSTEETEERGTNPDREQLQDRDGRGDPARES